MIGRLCSAPRVHGKSAFVHIFFDGERKQIYSNKEYKTWEEFCSLNQGDIVEVSGEEFVTQKGEPTIRISELTIIKRCEIGLPDKANGVGLAIARENPYLNLVSEIVSTDGQKPYRDTIIIRSKVLKSIRNFLDNLGFIEVQTPILVRNGFGCDAKPFITEDGQYLRIAPELELKKLVVGGFNKIYEIGKNFRNEGLSQRHNPEFTMLELYCTGGNWQHAINLTKDLIQRVITDLRYFDNDVSINSNFDWSFNPYILNEFIEEELIQPTFVRPKEESPLAKHNENGEAERFELYAGGMEIANGYSEQDNWKEQLKAFEQQGYVDEGYINALKVGLPPTFGIGIGIDRLIMLLTGRNIKEVL